MRFRIASNVDLRLGNPYLRVFAAALAPHGIEHTDTVQIDNAWLHSNKDRIDALHFHWPERHWERIPTRLRGPLAAVARHLPRAAKRVESGLQHRKLRRFGHFLDQAKRIGYRIFWTHHNAEPHESMSPVDAEGYAKLAAASDLVICHSQVDAAAFRSRYPACVSPTIMMHGNFRPIFPPPRDATLFRSQHFIPAGVTLAGCVGAMRAYKGLEVALDAARMAPKIHFLFAGEPIRWDVGPLLDAASQHRNIHVIPGRLTDQEYVDCVSACDVILLPHLTVTTSGALLGALSCSRPVVASRHPYFQEILAGEPQAGQLSEIGSATGLLQSLRFLLEAPAEARTRAAKGIASKYDWTVVIEPVVAAIGQIAVNRYPEIKEGLPTT